MKALRWISWIVILSMIFSLCASPQTASAQSKQPQSVTRDTLFVPGEVVVGFNEGGVKAQAGVQVSALAGQVGAQLVGSFGNTALLSFAPDADVQALAGQLASAPGVQYAEPNYISWIPEASASIRSAQQQLSQVTRKDLKGKEYSISVKDLLAMRTISHGKAVSTYANDMFNSWGVHKIGADMIWTETTASPQVCVLDTGVDKTHPDLAGKVVAGWDFINNDSSVVDDNGHGTHVTGTIVAKSNDGVGPAGISNGQVLVVKVMTAQGWGTAYDIAKGIRYCADSGNVKVLNMSLGGPTSNTEYSALDYAINSKGKLVVAAAGNDSTEVRTNAYPAAWSDDPPDPNANPPRLGLGHGLIAVGAARSPWTRYDASDGTYHSDIAISDGSDDPYYENNCATKFSNYGPWVNIVAPGEDIFSTTPYSSPFWLNMEYQISPKYAEMSGTSMAAPHVAAAAARVWSLFKTSSNNEVKNRLIMGGDGLTMVEDPAFTSSNQQNGYDNDPEDTPYYQGDGPFCWPESMANASYLNLSAAMQRGAIESKVTDAITGLPLVGATIQALIDNTKTIKASGAIAGPYENWVDLINLPADSYTLKVSASGYTSGIQPYDYGVHVDSGQYTTGSPVDIPVPPNNKNYTVVANWTGYADLGLFLWIPQDSPSAIIGPNNPGNTNISNIDNIQGTLADFPYARFYRYEYMDSLTMESIGISSSGTYPHYNSAGGNQIYNVLMTDFYDGGDLEYASPYVRVWYGGIAHFLAADRDGCGGGNNWWHAGSFYRSGNGMKYMYTSDYSCGTGATSDDDPDFGIWPYSTEGSIIIKAMDQPAK